MHLLARDQDGHTVAASLADASGDEPLVIGRGIDAGLRLEHDPAISRRHATAVRDGRGVRLVCYENARNGFVVSDNAEPVRDVRLEVGESVVLGQTRLTLRDGSPDEPTTLDFPQHPGERADATPASFAPDRLSQTASEQPIGPLGADRVARDDRLSVLSRLPAVLDAAVDEAERLRRVASLVLVGVRAAESVAIVSLGDGNPATAAAATKRGGPVLLHAWDRRHATAGVPAVSARLVAQALESQAAIVHCWPADADGLTSHVTSSGNADASSDAAPFTQTDEADWAIAVPIDAAEAIVVAGTDSVGRTADFRVDAKFVDLVAELLRTERQNRTLTERLVQLRPFFSPPVMQAIEQAAEASPAGGGGDPTESGLLTPRECELAVLFADLQGYSRNVEVADDLLAELHAVRAALATMTAAVLEHHGTTGEFLGDAVLGFWGWPLVSGTAAADCCRAAVQIAAAFADQPRRPGIGLAFGRGVAGRITTGDRVSINAFGPPLNLASRLQSLTRTVGVPILVDDAMRKRAVAEGFADERFGLVDRIVPRGLASPCTVWRLYGEGEAADAAIEDAAAALVSGDKRRSGELLAPLDPHDPVVRYLRDRAAESR